MKRSKLINSYLLVDLESTGLPRTDTKTKITELSILGVLRSHLIECHKKKEELPRVIQKLNLCVYPRRMVHYKASEVSGLSNDLLEFCRPFDDHVFSMIRNLVDMMPGPACLLAHNGNIFDFPLLKAEIDNINKELPDDVVCADTLLAFRELFSTERKEPEVVHPLPLQPGMDVDGVPVKISWESQTWDADLCAACEIVEQNDSLMDITVADVEARRLENETTPTRKPIVSSSARKPKEVVRNLFKVPKRPSFRLGDCHQRLCGYGIDNAHQADSDTHALLRCVVKMGEPMLDWFDNNCKPFNTVKKMW